MRILNVGYIQAYLIYDMEYARRTHFSTCAVSLLLVEGEEYQTPEKVFKGNLSFYCCCWLFVVVVVVVAIVMKDIVRQPNLNVQLRVCTTQSADNGPPNNIRRLRNSTIHLNY